MFTQPSAYTENLVLNQQHRTDLFGSAIKALAATSFARRMKATHMKKPQPPGNRATKQPHPRCEKHGKLAKMHVVKNLLKSNYGRPFFVCSDQSNPCSFWVWGDVQHVAKPKCRHGFPRVIRKVKKETINKDRLFFCCAQEDSCNYFEWVPEEIKQNDKREEQYPTENFISANDLADLKDCFRPVI